MKERNIPPYEGDDYFSLTHPQMLQACIRDVAAFTRIENLGYTIPDMWADLVDQAVI
jgi:hypothetical protein